jgi:hypothetical protein
MVEISISKKAIALATAAAIGGGIMAYNYLQETGGLMGEQEKVDLTTTIRGQVVQMFTGAAITPDVFTTEERGFALVPGDEARWHQEILARTDNKNDARNSADAWCIIDGLNRLSLSQKVAAAYNAGNFPEAGESCASALRNSVKVASDHFTKRRYLIPTGVSGAAIQPSQPPAQSAQP